VAGNLKSGGILGFVSLDITSNVINLATLGIPGYSIHHVGILGRQHAEPLLYESTTAGRPPCVRLGRPVKGVQAHTIDELIAMPCYRQIWHYSLRAELYADEEERLLYYLDSIVGLPYDMGGAIRSGGVLLSLLSRLVRDEELKKLCCPEVCMAALAHINRVSVPNASYWSPNRMLRYLVRNGIYNQPVRIK
jgi:hypothetical protein